MAKKTTPQDLLNSPIDYLYIFASDTEFLPYIKADKAKIISKKKANQVKFVNTVAVQNGTTYEAVVQLLFNQIKEQYGLTPGAILTKLSMGENIAGKDWSAGVYGACGDTHQSTYNQDTTYKVDDATGLMYTGSLESNAGFKIKDSAGNQVIPTEIFDNKGNVCGYSYSVDGKQFSTAYDKKTGKWYADTYSDGTTMQYANGAPYTASSASSVWQNILTSLPELQKFIEWLVSLFTGNKLITTQNTAPSQKEFVTYSGFGSGTLTGIIGLALVGGFLLFNGGKLKMK